MKKRFFCSILAAVVSISVFPDTFVQAATDISIGNYVQMGAYYGEPILWRCVDIDENGPLMLSDRIICLKPYDAAGVETSGSHGRGYYSEGTQGLQRRNNGSDYWADSNIRSWLNSDAEAGNVEWLCGNPPDSSHILGGYNAYADEQGFKRNFTSYELDAVKTVTQKSLLNAYEESSTDNKFNQKYHIFDYYIINILQNYAAAYSEEVTDDFFLLDVKQVNAVYNNRRFLGAEYYIGKPTKACVDNSENKPTALSDSKNWRYWLRSPNSYSSGFSVRQVEVDGFVFYDAAYKGIGGVRPAFYLDLSSAKLASGSGTSADPYILGRNERVTAEVKNTGLTDTGAVITAYLDNSYSRSVAGDVYFAVYDEAGKLSEIEKRSFLLDSQEKSEDITVTFSGSGFSTYKLFVWDNMNPLGDMVSSEFPQE